MFGLVPTHEIRFPGVKGSGCARINNTVPQVSYFLLLKHQNNCLTNMSAEDKGPIMESYPLDEKSKKDTFSLLQRRF